MELFNPNRIFIFSIVLLIFGSFKGASAAADEEDMNVGNTSERAIATTRYSILYKWKSLNIRFPTKELKAKLLASGEYIPKNNVLAGVRVYGDKMYVGISCFRPGVPVTLAVMDFKPSSKRTIRNPILTAYPSYEFQEVGNCTCLQYVQQMEIDQYGRMWLIDTGRLDILTATPRNLCPPKLVLIDLQSGRILKYHTFPPNVASPTAALLDDIAVACKSPINCFAFITNPSENLLTIYDLLLDKSWSVSHSSMNIVPSAVNITVLGKSNTRAV